jgi:hypothetical protein
MMQQPFGHTTQFRLLPAQAWLSLGPGWAAAAGILSGGRPELNLATLVQFISLWLVVDPILGTMWTLVVEDRLWWQIRQARLPPPPLRGFSIPYAQPGSLAGRLVLLIRRYQVWWQQAHGPASGSQAATFVLGLILAPVVAAALQPAIFWLVVLALSLTLLAGLNASNPRAASGGRLQSIVQMLLPWFMGNLLWSNPTLPTLALALCYWLVYLGGLRMAGRHRRAEILFVGGQIAAILLLLALRLLPGATALSALLVAQLILKNHFSQPAQLLKKVQPYLVFGLLVAAWSSGNW